jgi:cytochrome c55X
MLTALLAGVSVAADPPPGRRAELLHLLRHDCGSCHGMRLAGGLGPPLTAAALHGIPDAVLIATISHGRPGTPMPPWRGLLSGAEVRWMVRTLKSGTLE